MLNRYQKRVLLLRPSIYSKNHLFQANKYYNNFLLGYLGIKKGIKVDN